MASLANPQYKAVVKTSSGKRYDLFKSRVILDLTISDDPDSLAKFNSNECRSKWSYTINLDTAVRPIIYFCRCWEWVL